MADSDTQTRGYRLHRAIRELVDLRERPVKPRIRFRQRNKVEEAVGKILDERCVREFLKIMIKQRSGKTYWQANRGRPTEKTQYAQRVETRCDLTWKVCGGKLDRALAGDGVFPLITNICDLAAEEILKS